MSKVWSVIVDMVEEKFVSEVTNCILRYSDGEYLETAIGNLLAEHEDVVQYKTSSVDAFESPGYDTGIIYAAWVESDGELHMIDYQWEAR